MAKLWKSDWVATRSEPNAVGSIQRVAKNGRWADVKWHMEGKEWSKRMLTKYLLLRVEIPQPGGMTVSDGLREDSLADHSGENFSFCDQPCHRKCSYEAPCQCCKINPWRKGMSNPRRVNDLGRAMFHPLGPGPHHIWMLPPAAERLTASLARVLGMTEGNLWTALGVDLSAGRARTSLTMVEIPGPADVRPSVIIPSPLYDFLYAEIATGFPPVIAENLALRIAKCLENFGVPIPLSCPLSCLRVQPTDSMMVMVHIAIDEMNTENYRRMVEMLMSQRGHVSLAIPFSPLGNDWYLHSRRTQDDPLDGIEDPAETDNAVAELVELVKRDNRALFDEMAPIIGIPVESLNEVWDGIKKRTKG